jgi:ribosomal-protein-alanine N-acetyltransferase
MVIKSPGTRTQGLVRTPMIIRNFKESDLPAVMDLVETTFNEHYDPNLYLGLAKKWPDGLMVAESGDELVAFLMATEQRPLQSRILILCVKERLRGLGIGQAMMRAIVDRSIRKGYRKMTLEVRISNEGGLNFYARLGFEMIGLIPNFYANGESAFLLKRMLY